MKIELYSSGVYKVLKISDYEIISHLEELRYLVDGYLAEKEKHIAISFSNTSYLYSGAVAALVSCLKKLKDADGDMCILEPNGEIYELLSQMGISQIMPIYTSESELPDSSMLHERDNRSNAG
ncbi:MAG: STAS domain-containing protein [Fibrobacterota bacterium]